MFFSQTRLQYILMQVDKQIRASKAVNLVVMQSFETVSFLLFLFIPTLIMKTPLHRMNLPNKEFWFAEKMQEVTKKKMEVIIYEFGISTLVFFAMISTAVFNANVGFSGVKVSLDTTIVGIFTVIYIAYTIVWVIRLVRSFGNAEKQRIEKKLGI